jgi:hypothetical protein
LGRHGGILVANDEHPRMVDPIEAEAFVMSVAVSAWREDTVSKAAEWLEHTCSDRTGTTRAAPDVSEPAPLYRNRTLRVVDVVTVPGTTIVEGVRFENCRLIGPAVVYLMESVLDGAAFHVDKHNETIIWDVKPNTDKVGLIAMVNCVFVDCVFAQLGFAMTPPQKRAFLASLNR